MKLEKTHMKTLADLREQIQEDILTYIEFYGQSAEMDAAMELAQTHLCQVVVERFNEYTNELR